MNEIKLTPKQLKNFMAKVVESDRCWSWTSKKDKDGYGNFYVDGKTIRAHRLAWMIYRGKIDDGKWVLHRCDNPQCTRPDHLWLGTPSENRVDMFKKGRENLARGDNHWSRKHPEKVLRGESVGNSKLKIENVISIRNDYAAGIRQVDLANKHGVSIATICRAIHGACWKSV
ncbi:MAG: HNH endonuclease [Patescibacteria group bacterium]|nr:HNH endonuclease [Patescibacteria group bacterium]